MLLISNAITYKFLEKDEVSFIAFLYVDFKICHNSTILDTSY